MIELKDVSKYYNSNGVVTVALEHINLRFNKNEIVAITGESGSGKSTLLNIITAMDNYDEGEIYYKGNETSYFNNADMDSFRKKHVGFIFQNYNIIDSYTVLQNVMLPLLINGYSKKEAKQKALALIEKVGLTKRLKNRGSKLSGGEKQRVVIARALASDSDILACDEPTGNLDSKTGKEIIDLLKEVAKDKLVLIVTHNYDEVKDIVSRKVTLSDGKVINDEIIKAVEDDENIELDLDSEKVKKQTLGLLTKFNMLSTPRKSLLISLVFIAIALIIYTIPQSIYVNIKESNMTYNYGSYPVCMDNYIVVTDPNGLDSSKLDSIKGDISYNPLVEFTSFSFKDTFLSNEFDVYFADYEIESELIKELEPEENLKQANLIFPKNYYFPISASNQYKIKNKNNEVMELSIKEIRESKYVKKPIIQMEGLKDFLNRGILKSHIEFKINDQIIKPKLGTSGLVIKYPKVLLADELNVNISLAGAYELDLPYTLEPTNESSIQVYASKEFFNSLELKPYEARLVASDYEAAISKLNELNLSYIHPASYSEDLGFIKLMLLVNTISLILPFIIIYLMSYFILSKIYASKTKEYSIMRVLGICKNDMFKMVTYETIVFGLINALFVYLITIILGFTIPHDYFRMYRDLNAYISIFYFVVIFIFSYFLARKFNKKLFSQTNAKTLKEANYD